MLPLYRDPCLTFHFAEDRIIRRCHLEGVATGSRVEVFKVEAVTCQCLDLLATTLVGDGGWVELTAPTIVRAGDTFIAVPAGS